MNDKITLHKFTDDLQYIVRMFEDKWECENGSHPNKYPNEMGEEERFKMFLIYYTFGKI